jgi:formate/nitrite transporter FocA (FNT family)
MEDKKKQELTENPDSTILETSKKNKASANSRSFVEILSKQMLESFEVYRMQWKSLFLNSSIAGLEIGFSYLLIATLFQLLVDKISSSYIFHLFALVYPIGFLMVVLGKSILFTEQTALLTLPVLNRNKSFLSLLKIWLIVITGNLTGGIIFSTLTFLIAPSMGIFNTDTMVEIAIYVLDIDIWVMFFSALLAGWLMGLMSWVLNSTDETISKILLVFIITGTIGFLGLHHSIIGNIEVFAGYLATHQITFTNYASFLFVVLFGNAVGGAIFVALFKYSIFISTFPNGSNNQNEAKKE